MFNKDEHKADDSYILEGAGERDTSQKGQKNHRKENCCRYLKFSP